MEILALCVCEHMGWKWEMIQISFGPKGEQKLIVLLKLLRSPGEDCKEQLDPGSDSG